MDHSEATARARVLADEDRRRETLANEQFHIGDEVTLDGASAWIVISRELVDPIHGRSEYPTYEISNLNGDREIAQARFLELVKPGPYMKFG